MQVGGFDSDRGGVERRLLAQTASVTRYDQDIQNKARQVLQKKKELSTVQASVEDGVVTLTGTVDLYQNKLDAARKVRKLQSVAGVRNLITVAGPSVADEQLADQLSRKLYYDRDGYYDGPFNYFTLAVKDGVVTVGGETLSDVGRDSALSLIQRTPGVKDVISNIAVSPVSLFDDNLRRRAVLVIYRDPVMSKYAIDPARPIRIIVNGGNISLYGTVDSPMDKQIAGMRASSVFGAFRVQNNLEIAGQSNAGL